MARFTDAFTSQAIAAIVNENASNRIPYLGEGLFPRVQKSGLNLKWFKQNLGLPVILKPSAFDANATIRSRQGLEVIDTEMAYFKEAMIVKEQDIQDYETVVEGSPYAREILDRNFRDAETLIESARVVEERMRMSLLANANGKPSISIAAEGVTYAYDFDPNGTYASNNFTALSGTSLWSDTANSTPLEDVSEAQDKVEAKTGERPSILLISKATMNLLKQNASIRSAILAQNVTANIFMTDNRVKELFSNELGISIIVYTKQYVDENGTAKKFYPDGMATLLPNGQLGNTYKGVTPEEHRAGELNVQIVDDGTAVAVNTSFDPVQTVTKASEVVLPSFENMDRTYMIKVEANVTY
jgi:hypothetical protein